MRLPLPLPLLLLLGAAHAGLRLRYNGQLPIRDAPSPKADGYYTPGSFVPYFWASTFVDLRPNAWGDNGVGHVTNDATVSLTVEYTTPPDELMVMKMYCMPREAPLHEASYYLSYGALKNRRTSSRFSDGCTCTVDGVDQGAQCVGVCSCPALPRTLSALAGYPCPTGPLPNNNTRRVVSCPIFRSAADSGPWPGGSLPCMIAVMGDTSLLNPDISSCVDVWLHHSSAYVPPSPPPSHQAGAHPGVYDFFRENSYLDALGSCSLEGIATVPEYASSDASVPVALDASCTTATGVNITLPATLTVSYTHLTLPTILLV